MAKHVLCSLLVSSILPLALCNFTRENIFNDCFSTTDQVSILPDTRLSVLNPWLAETESFQRLVAAGCGPDRDAGAVCQDKPAIGSGLAQLSPTMFLGLTDRGPNQDCEDLFEIDPARYAEAAGKKGKGFPVPEFAPTIVHFSPDDSTRQLNLLKTVPLRGMDGHPITGLSNSDRDDTPYAADCIGNVLDYDPSGLDTEDLARIPGTDYVAIVDEYSPSVVIADFQTGVIVARHVPLSLGPVLENARYPIVADIPDVYTNRRKNRGFEGVVVDTDGKYVIAILQSPMLGEDEDATENNAIIRCAYFNIVSIEDGVPSLKYSYSFIIEASAPSAYVDKSNVPKDMKYSGGQHLAYEKFIALERAKGQVKLFYIDFSEATHLDDTEFADNLGLESGTNGLKRASQLGIRAATKILVWDSFPIVGGSKDFSGGFKQEGFVIDMVDETKLWIIDDNDFGLENNENVEMRKMSLGRSRMGATVCKLPDHPPTPSMNIEPTRSIRLTNSQTLRISSEIDGGAAENLDVHEDLQRAYVANTLQASLDMYDLSTTVPTFLDSYTAGVGYKPTSASVCEEFGFVAVALENDEDETAPGRIDILTTDLKVFRRIVKEDCILPDHVAWSPTCLFLVAACEGEGADVRGGILVGDFGGAAGERFRGATVATFDKYDAIADIVVENGIRLIESNKPSVDFEPEYGVVPGNHAFVTLQENNAIAVVDLQEAVVAEVKPIGYIERSRVGFGLDASNRDDGIHIANYAFLYGMPQPDAIGFYRANDGGAYLVFVNEGDAKDDAEEARGADITDADELGRSAVPGLKELVEDDALLGRLKFSTIMGFDEETNTQMKMFHFGSRSFSIMSVNGSVVFDSGEWFARIEERFFARIFNSNGFDDEDLSLSQEDLFDDRSDDKGMEPESLSLMKVEERTYAFIGFERASIIVVFDITLPAAPVFIDAVSNHPSNVSVAQLFAQGQQGDMDPEGLFASSKLHKLIVGGSVSNTLSTYDIEM